VKSRQNSIFEIIHFFQKKKKNADFSYFLGLMSRNNKESKRALKVVVDLVAIGAQATGFFIWPIVEIGRGHTKTWAVPVAIFLVIQFFLSIFFHIRIGKVGQTLFQCGKFTFL
jgi:hypothetical protein